MKAETQFRKSKVIPFLKTLRNTYFFPIQQLAFRGEADFILCSNGRFIALELKTDVGKPSALQFAKLAWVQKTGGIAIVARPDNWEAVKQKLTEIDGGTYAD